MANVQNVNGGLSRGETERNKIRVDIFRSLPKTLNWHIRDYK